MHFHDYEYVIKKHPSIAGEVVEFVAERKIYYLVRGRNAWHSTWVQHYYPGCMATKLLDVERNAEEKRTFGSVFYVKELPAIAVQTKSGVLVVTEINTDAPLSGYSKIAVHRDAPKGKVLTDGARDSYFAAGSPVSLFAMSFEVDSRFWRKLPPPRDAVILLFVPNGVVNDLEPLSDKLYQRKSQPSGRRLNSLCWSITSSKIDGSYIKTLTSEASSSQRNERTVIILTGGKSRKPF